MQLGFGSGVLVGTALTDYAGTALAVATPVQFGVLQDVSIDFSFDIKELFGQYQFPVAIGRGKGKITGKAKLAQINGLTVNSLIFGQTMVAGTLADVIATTGVAIPITPFQITVVPPSSGTYAVDLGVLGPTGLPLTKVVSGPVTGQYSQAGAIYTFAAADVALLMRISYQYTATSTVARKITIANVLMGQAPTFRADFLMPYGGNQFVVSLPACTGSKFSLATKLDDFLVPEFDFSAFADASGNVCTIGLSE